MKFLVDESCDLLIVHHLRASGHDVLAIVETTPALSDEEVIRIALKEKRIVFTEDKDFGQLVFGHLQKTGGIVLVRFPANARHTLPRAIDEILHNISEGLVAFFAVLQPGHIRVTRILPNK